MEILLLDEIKKELKKGNKVAYVIIIDKEGSTPRGEGTSMVVKIDGTTLGTVGGGISEFKATNEAKKCIKRGISKTLDLSLNIEPKNIESVCGGNVKVFIKTYIPQNKLILAGGGHVAYALYKFALELGFLVTVFDDREEFASKDRFPKADKLYYGDIIKNLNEIEIDDTTYIVVASKTHKSDENILSNLVKTNAKYIGMLGSRKKVDSIFNSLIKNGVKKEDLDKIYAPIGIGIGGETPEEIALSIISEIIKIKNDGKERHMKEIKI